MHQGCRAGEEMRMRRRTWFGSTLVALLALGALVMPAPVDAGCGCSKPPPRRAAVRPFVGYADQKIVLFSDLLVPNTNYWVQFTATADGSTDWSRGRAALRRDFADGQARVQMRVPVGNVALGPCSITVWADRSTPLYTLADDQCPVRSNLLGVSHVTPHIAHARIVVAISGMLMSGSRPAPAATPPFELVVQSVPSEAPLQ